MVFESRGKLNHHRIVIACIVTGDSANLRGMLTTAMKEAMELQTLCAIPNRIAILNNACPSRLPSWAVFMSVNPNKALCNTHFPGTSSSIQCPVTAKYASVFAACHASHVKLTSPVTYLLYRWVSLHQQNIWMIRVKHTLSRSFKWVSWALNMSIISALVALRFGSLTPWVARAATLIMFWKEGCSRAWTGYWMLVW